MEFDLEALFRDWIDGISGAQLVAQIRDLRTQLADGPIVIRETDPIQFAITFFAALANHNPIVLANPQWGKQELVEFESVFKATPIADGSILIPTGGTTGGVKLAIHDWKSLTTASRDVQSFLGGEPIHSCCLLPLYHVSGLMQLIRSFVSGGCIYFDDAFVEGRCVSLVPTQLQRILNTEPRIQHLTTARAIFVGGSAMNTELSEAARERELPIIPVYGMTETAAMCAAIPNVDFLNDPKAGAVPIGGARFTIEADRRIRIHSEALFKGYQGGTKIDSTEGYLTGDLGTIDTDGRLHVIGRADRIIITGGEKVDPAEVEAVLRTLDGVTDAKVFGATDPDWGQRVTAHYTGDSSVIHSEWKATLKKKLSTYKIPKELIHVDRPTLSVKEAFQEPED